ncbi:hypothetical protein EK904_000286 [Melospiza melodia maxima]|nr:hypothetical protein EK904_000286 [Melospiza melodia maxima]
MSSESFLKEVQAIGEKFLLKLQKLPKAEPVEIVSFSVVLLFIAQRGNFQVTSTSLQVQQGVPSPQAKISWRSEEEATEETPTTNHNSFSRVEASMSLEQEASSELQDLKSLIATSGWALGGLVVIVIFCSVFIALILFAAVFGCCTSPRHRRGGS